MSGKDLILSSSGLKNLVFSSQQENEFIFIFNERTVRMKTTFAEFISPKVCQLHQSDPTLESINLSHQVQGTTINSNVLSKFKSLSEGEKININEEESFQMKIISILLDNEELFNKVTELYSSDINETNVEIYLNNLSLLYKISPFPDRFNQQFIIDFISSHFSSIDPSKLIQLPKHILYAIISNDHLKIDSEDSLFEFIQQIFRENNCKEAEQDVGMIAFLEQLNFVGLSEEKFIEFIEEFNPTEMTNDLWKKLCDCFYINKNRATSTNNRYSKKAQQFQYEGSPFSGIIDHLTKESGGNVAENGTVKVTQSASGCGSPRNVVDFQNDYLIQSPNTLCWWLKFDFGDRKVHPTHYSIKTRYDGDCYHPRNWVIEGTNADSDNDDDWKVLDSRQNDTNLKGINYSHTFEMNKKIGARESFRYIRIRQTDLNSNNCYYITFSALEFFGSLC